MIAIPKELRQAVQESKDNLVRLIDPETKTEYVILSAETFKQMQNGVYYNQIPEGTSQGKDAETAVPNRSIPEEAYSPVKVRKPTYTLSDLLDQVTEDNLHDEVDTGPAVGNEVC